MQHIQMSIRELPTGDLRSYFISLHPLGLCLAAAFSKEHSLIHFLFLSQPEAELGVPALFFQSNTHSYNCLLICFLTSLFHKAKGSLRTRTVYHISLYLQHFAQCLEHININIFEWPKLVICLWSHNRFLSGILRRRKSNLKQAHNNSK